LRADDDLVILLIDFIHFEHVFDLKHLVDIFDFINNNNCSPTVLHTRQMVL
jgi:hypothetical protein